MGCGEHGRRERLSTLNVSVWPSPCRVTSDYRNWSA